MKYIALGKNSHLCSSTYDCFGCREKIEVKIGEPYNHDDVTSLMQRLGWRRRSFNKGARPWFCSFECAYKSEAALYCENYWRNYEGS